MEQRTHVIFTLMVIVYLDSSSFPTTKLLIQLPIGIILGILCANLPNTLDKLMYKGFNESRLLGNCRHPLTHHPFTGLYWMVLLFIDVGYLLQGVGIIVDTYYIQELLFRYLSISWFCHLFLDMLSSEGLPLWIKPIFEQDPTKNYLFKQLTLNAPKINIFQFSRDNRRINDIATICCSITLSILLIFLANSFYINREEVLLYLEVFVR